MFQGNNRIVTVIVYIHFYVLIAINKVTTPVIFLSLKKEIQLKK